MEWLKTADPDLSRTLLAARATLTVALAGFGLTAFAHLIDVPASVAFFGASVGMISTISVKDGSVRAQRITSAWLLLPVAVSATIGTFAASTVVASSVALVLTSFCSVALQRFGPRGTSMGALAFNAMFFSLFFHSAVGQVHWLVLCGFAGVGIASVVRFVVLPDRPARAVTRGLQAIPLLGARVLRASASQLRDESPVGHRKLLSALQKLNETALMLEDHLEQLGTDARAPHLRQTLLSLELATERVVANTRDLRRSRETANELKEVWAQTLEAAAEAVELRGDTARKGTPAWEAAERMRELVAEAVALAPPDTVASVLSARLQLALSQLLVSTPDDPTPPIPKRAAEPAAPKPPAGVTLRQATQAAVAAALALVVGRWIASDRWLWAVLAAHVVMAPASTRGDIFVRAWRRTLGTAFGALLGIGLAVVVQGHERIELLLLFVCVFLGLFELKRSYAVMVFWFTALLAILTSWQGHYSPQLLGIRLAETLAGAGIGTITAWLLFPIPTGGKVRSSLSAVLTATSHAFAERTVTSIRAVDRAVRDLRAAAEPMTRGTFPVSPETVEVVRAAASLAFYSRQLAMMPAAAFDDALEVLQKNAAAMAEAVTKGGTVALAPLPADAAPHPAGQVLTQRLFDTLGRIHVASGTQATATVAPPAPTESGALTYTSEAR